MFNCARARVCVCVCVCVCKCARAEVRQQPSDGRPQLSCLSDTLSIRGFPCAASCVAMGPSGIADICATACGFYVSSGDPNSARALS